MNPLAVDGFAGADRADATGHPRVDEVMSELAAVADLPPAGQLGPLAHAHQALQETLDSIGDV
jgi:hypothetical protein